MIRLSRKFHLFKRWYNHIFLNGVGSCLASTMYFEFISLALETWVPFYYSTYANCKVTQSFPISITC